MPDRATPGRARILPAGILIASWLVTAASALAADLSPAQQLQRMAQSLRSLDYQGSFLYQNGGRLDTLRIFHSSGGTSGERERLISLSGPRSEAVRHAELITYSRQDELPTAFSGGATARLLPLVPTVPGSLPDASYGLRLGGADRVAGYEAQIIDIVPVDHYRYGYRIWLERSNQLPLRVALLSDDQRVLEQYMFLMLSVGTAPTDGELKMSEGGPTAAPTSAVASVSSSARWRIDDLPAGFTLTARHASTQLSHNAEQLVFSDGLASVSAYIEPIPAPMDEDVALNRGAMNVYIHRNGGWRYTVLGNVPSATVQRIALSLRPIGSADSPN